MNRFEEVKERNLNRLTQFVPVVARVHGGHHPEFHQVQAVFDRIHKKINEAGALRPVLEEEFKELRHITENYKVPEDVCESYEAVYRMLLELDEAFEVQ